jgi:hypothetical protein
VGKIARYDAVAFYLTFACVVSLAELGPNDRLGMWQHHPQKGTVSYERTTQAHFPQLMSRIRPLRSAKANLVKRSNLL